MNQDTSADVCSWRGLSGYWILYAIAARLAAWLILHSAAGRRGGRVLLVCWLGWNGRKTPNLEFLGSDVDMPQNFHRASPVRPSGLTLHLGTWGMGLWVLSK